MADRRWTVVLVPHGDGSSRSVQVSLRGFRILVGVLAVLGVSAVAFGYVTITKAINLTRLDRLERRNELLTRELDQAQTLVASLGDTISSIAERDELVRLLAGLDPTDPAVQLAGIGGPTGPWTEREQILSEGTEGRLALDMRSELDNLIRRANLLANSYGDAVDSLQSHRDQTQRTPSIWPTKGWLTSNFATSRMHPIFHEARPHEGIDVSAAEGTPIFAPAAGRVVNVRTMTGYGRTLTIDHGYGVQTFYAHASKVLVRVGQWVNRNDKIAEVGSTGIATGPHLHYEVIVNGRAVDPRNYILPAKVVD